MTVYNEDPLEVAQQFEDHGLDRLHLVDLDGAKAKNIVNYRVLEKLASRTSLFIDFGGGIQSDEDIRIAFESGAKQITGGSIAVKNPLLFETWILKYGADKIILGADVKDKKIAVSGWLESSQLEITDFLSKYLEKEIKYVISTDVSKDGVLEGPSFKLYEELQEKFPELNIIASGGVSGMDDVYALAEKKLFGVIIGKAIYEGRIDLKDLSTFAA